jgi:hypothetical protein
MSDEIARRVASYLGERQPTDRPASFDYCYNYFQGFRERGDIRALASDDHLQESCLQLGFYLASWGMLRGSSELLRRSLKYYVPVVHTIAELSEDAWDLHVPGYDEDSVVSVLDAVRRIRSAFQHQATDTLVTKVLLGVLGCVPAYDTDFRKGFSTYTPNRKSLLRLRAFYDEHAGEIEACRPRTLDFRTESATERLYPVAKVMDMVFIQGKL